MTTYCVVCRGRVAGQYSRTMRFYLSAASAAGAVAAAAQENPEFRVLGIEPGHPLGGTRNSLQAA
jgi:hypothetical protein